MESCTKRTTVSRASINSSSDSLPHGYSARKFYYDKERRRINACVFALSLRDDELLSVAPTFFFCTDVDVIDIGVVVGDHTISTR